MGNLTSDATVTFSSAFAARSRAELRLISGLSLLLTDAFDGLLSGELFAVDNEFTLSRILLTGWRPFFLCHIRWEFLRLATFASLFEDGASFSRTELLWRAVSD
jgi:hypothetical protein